MQFSSSFPLLSATLLLLCAAQASHAQQLFCYVCENCTKITAETPLLQCDEGFFNTGGTTLSSTMTTTNSPSSQSTTDAISTTTTQTTEETTTSIETTTPTTTDSTSSTEPPVPTPPTITTTTTDMPTPPNPGTVPSFAFDILQSNTSAKPYTPSSQLRLRQQRQIETTTTTTPTNAGYTYHCYRLKKSVNGILETERGCTRITTNESVCNHLESANNDTTIRDCFPCDNPRCNGSSALAVSLLTMCFAVVAALLRHN